MTLLPVEQRVIESIPAGQRVTVTFALEGGARFRESGLHLIHAKLSDAEAMKLMEEYLAVESDRLEIRREYLDDFAAVLPGRTVARLYQIENKIDALIRYDLAREIPVVDAPTPD